MKSILSTAILLFAFSIFSQEKAVFSTKAGAIKGYDPVAYFKEGKPVKGVKEHSVQWNGAVWYFASAENKKAFQEDPESYAPQYGGYCAYGVSKGGLFKTEPEAWSIVEGKLYLNYNLSIKKDWEEDIPGYIQKADSKWPGLLKDE